MVDPKGFIRLGTKFSFSMPGSQAKLKNCPELFSGDIYV